MAPNADIRPVTIADAAGIWQLVCDCPELDSNSFYAYAVLCSYFSSTCFVAEIDGELAGFLTAFVSPADPEVCFAWQLCIVPAYRGLGLASALFDHLITSAQPRFVEATITPDNDRSLHTFAALARRHGTEITESVFLAADDFPLSASHSPEHCFRVGPLR